MNRIFNIKLLITTFFITFLTVSCQEKMIFSISEDPGYTDSPIAVIKALDGDRWIEGTVDDQNRTITFEFHVLDDFSKVPLKVELNGKWPEMVTPETPEFEANLETQFKISVNDGVDVVSYDVIAPKYEFVKSVKLVKGEEEVECTLNYLAAKGKFGNLYLYSDLKDVKVEVELGDSAVFVTDPKSLEAVDFTKAGRSLNIKIKDVVSGHYKTLVVDAAPADVVTLDESWTDVTAEYKKKHALSTLSSSIRIYKTSSLNYSEGNIGYLMTIPAGKVNMQVLEKARLGSNDAAKISAAVRANPDWSIFFYMNGPGVWHIDGSSASEGFTYYSPLVYSAGEVLRQEGWGGQPDNIMYAPALAVKDGKAMIAPARTDKAANRLYRYSDASGNGEQDWSDVDCAVGGYFMIVNAGDNLITGRGDVLIQYSHLWRTFPGYSEDGTCLLTNFTTPSWSTSLPVTDHDALRIGRHAVGVTAKGDLVLFTVEKYLNTHNQGQGKYNKMNGATSDPYGLTLSELSFIMSEMGCSEVMTLEDYNWCSFVLQDGGSRGHDLFMVNRRYNFTTGEMRPESDEFVNLAIACFK